MPIFEFKCLRCSHEFEDLVRSGGQAIACPNCRSEQIEKKFSVFGFSAGGGFVSSAPSSGCSSCRSHNCKGCK